MNTETTTTTTEIKKSDIVAEAEAYLMGGRVNERELRNDIMSYLEMNPAPIIADGKALFVYIGKASSVSVAGDWNRWDPAADPMTRVGEGMWILVKNFPEDARLDYKFVVNGSEWLIDPLNPRTCLGGFGPNSELVMPAHKIPPWYEVSDEIPKGALEELSLTDDKGKTHLITLYRPPTEEIPRIIIYFYDGKDYLILAKANRILDYLVSEGLIPPAYAVFVSPSSPSARIEEYGRELEATDRFLVGKVLPEAEKRLDIVPEARVIVGDSLAGLMATYTRSSTLTCSVI